MVVINQFHSLNRCQQVVNITPKETHYLILAFYIKHVHFIYDLYTKYTLFV